MYLTGTLPLRRLGHKNATVDPTRLEWNILFSRVDSLIVYCSSLYKIEYLLQRTLPHIKPVDTRPARGHDLTHPFKN
jgi:hypothetical protein